MGPLNGRSTNSQHCQIDDKIFLIDLKKNYTFFAFKPSKYLKIKNTFANQIGTCFSKQIQPWMILSIKRFKFELEQNKFFIFREPLIWILYPIDDVSKYLDARVPDPTQIKLSSEPLFKSLFSPVLNIKKLN